MGKPRSNAVPFGWKVKMIPWARYIELTKPKVTLLNIAVAVTSFLLAELPRVNWALLFVFAIIGYLAVGGSCALNCYFDRDMDSLMGRTRKRALPSGAIRPKAALVLGVVMLSAGVISSFAIFGALTSAVISLGAFVYVYVYTYWLKKATRWSVVVGGISGSLAAFYGWTATGSLLSFTPLLIATLDFFWTPGHLWGLAIRNIDDYRKAHVPALPVVEGVKRSSGWILAFNSATICVSLIFPSLMGAGLLYYSIATIAGLFLLLESLRLIKLRSQQQAFNVFLASMPYLAVILTALLLDKLFYLSVML